MKNPPAVHGQTIGRLSEYPLCGTFYKYGFRFCAANGQWDTRHVIWKSILTVQRSERFLSALNWNRWRWWHIYWWQRVPERRYYSALFQGCPNRKNQFPAIRTVNCGWTIRPLYLIIYPRQGNLTISGLAAPAQCCPALPA